MNHKVRLSSMVLLNHKVRIRRGFLPEDWITGKYIGDNIREILTDELHVTVPPNTEVMHIFFKEGEFLTVTITE